MGVVIGMWGLSGFRNEISGKVVRDNVLAIADRCNLVDHPQVNI